MCRFQALHTDKANRLSLGKDTQSEGYYLAIPVSNSMVDYMEYYRLTVEQFEQFKSDRQAAAKFAAACQKQEEEYDKLLIVRPGTQRGIPT